MELEGSCRCGGVRFRCVSHTPYPYMRCYCSICRKSAGAGGYAINIMAEYQTLEYLGDSKKLIKSFRAMVPGESGGAPQPSTNSRYFCGGCGSALWCFDPAWPDSFYPHAGAIDTPLPAPPLSVHILLGSKAPWVQPQVGPRDESYEEYPHDSILEFHKKHGLYVEGTRAKRQGQ